MIEWFPEDMTPEEKREFFSGISLDMRIRAHHLEMCYGAAYIVKNKDGIYELYYPNYDNNELKKDEKEEIGCTSPTG